MTQPELYRERYMNCTERVSKTSARSGPSYVRSSGITAFLAFVSLSTAASHSMADESGVSFWLPGQFGSLAAAPGTPGWALASVYYHTSVSAGADVAASREIRIGRFNPALNVNLNANLRANADLALFIPSYTFATPVLGGQLAVQMGTIVGSTSANVAGTLTASLPPFSLVRYENIGDSVTGSGDLYPQVSLKWNYGVNNRTISSMCEAERTSVTTLPCAAAPPASTRRDGIDCVIQLVRRPAFSGSEAGPTA
jgi:hypothetical protein